MNVRLPKIRSVHAYVMRRFILIESVIMISNKQQINLYFLRLLDSCVHKLTVYCTLLISVLFSLINFQCCSRYNVNNDIKNYYNLTYEWVPIVISNGQRSPLGISHGF